MSTRSRTRPWFRDPREIPKPTPPERYELDLDVPNVTFTLDLDELDQAPLPDCHARGCTVAVKPELLMCPRHWRQVPVRIQRAVWATYRRGQCDDMNPSREWHDAADAAIGYVAALERRALRPPEIVALAALGYTTTTDLAGELIVRERS